MMNKFFSAKNLINRFSFFQSLVLALMIGFFFPSPGIGEDDWKKQLEKALKSQLQKSLIDKYIRYDKKKNIVSFSPALMEMAVDKAGKSSGGNLQTLALKAVGTALNFSMAMKSGTQISASIEPDALELGPEEMAIVGRLPHGLNIDGIDLHKTVSGFFDNLFGSSPASLSSAVSSASPVPFHQSSSFGLTDFLKNFSVEGNTFRLKRPMKASALGRALSGGMGKITDGPSGSTIRRLPMNMDNGWLNLNLGDFNAEKVLLQFAMENLLKQVQGK